MKRYVAFRLALLLGGTGRVLDLGCGAGHDLALLRAAGLDPIGLDASAAMVRESRRRGERTLVRGAAVALPFTDGAVDACRIERVLMHVEDPGEVLAEVHRALRPGGFVTVFEPDWTTLTFASDIDETGAIGAALSRCRWPDIGGRLVELVEAAGFEVVDVVTEESRGGRLERVPLKLDSQLPWAIAHGRIDADVGAAWRAEQLARDAAGTFHARWTKTLVVAWRELPR